MGMFDFVDYECACPVCHGKVSGFQTKDKEEPSLDHYTPQEVDNFYSSCDKCGCWVDFERADKINFRRTIEGKADKPTEQYTKTLAL